MEWGGHNLVDAERRLLANALLDINNRRFILMSEACIPLFHFNYIYSYVLKSPYSFMTSVVDPDEHKTWKEDLLPEVEKKYWRKGDQWKELHRVVAITVVADTKYYPKFYNHFVCEGCDPWTLGFMDERYIPTLLHLRRGHRLANRTLTYVDWKNHEDMIHPHSFDSDEVTPQVLWEMKNTTSYAPFNLDGDRTNCFLGGEQRPCFLFARKFRPGALDRLMRLSQKVLGF